MVGSCQQAPGGAAGGYGMGVEPATPQSFRFGSPKNFWKVPDRARYQPKTQMGPNLATSKYHHPSPLSPPEPRAGNLRDFCGAKQCFKLLVSAILLVSPP